MLILPKHSLDFSAAATKANIHIEGDYKSFAVTLPHKEYYLDPEDPKNIDKAKFFYWRLIILADEEVVGEVSLKKDDLSFVKSTCYPYKPSLTERAIALAEESKEFEDDTYEIRYLNSPWSHVRHMWFHGERGDLFIAMNFMSDEIKIVDNIGEDYGETFNTCRE